VDPIERIDPVERIDRIERVGMFTSLATGSD
jgi:hypothetical protein